MRSRNSNAVFQPGELGEHFRSPDHGTFRRSAARISGLSG
jgi:hypothetical protein